MADEKKKEKSLVEKALTAVGHFIVKSTTTGGAGEAAKIVRTGPRKVDEAVDAVTAKRRQQRKL